jgi:hypothetical protein
MQLPVATSNGRKLHSYNVSYCSKKVLGGDAHEISPKADLLRQFTLLGTEVCTSLKRELSVDISSPTEQYIRRSLLVLIKPLAAGVPLMG